MCTQHQTDDVSIDPLPVDLKTSHADRIDAAEVPESIRSITLALASEQPPTNPLVVLQAARWWYVHGQGRTDPAFQWVIEWTRSIATDTPGDVDRFEAFLEYFVTLDVAEEPATLR